MSQSRLSRVEAFARMVAAVFKAVLYLLPIAINAVVATTAVLRDQRNRAVRIDIDADSEKILRSLGTDLDLRQTFIDALNDRITGVQQILALNGLDRLIDDTQPESISFKPFGVDLSTRVLASIVREVLNSPKPATIHIELNCAPHACSDPAAGEALLLVFIETAGGRRPGAYRIPLVNPALRRGLHEAIRRSADRFLEIAEPLITSDYYLNVPQGELFEDDRRRDWAKAEGMALRIGARDDRTSCVADLVVGMSRISRDQIEDGLAVERRAAGSPNADCQVQALTNMVFCLYSHAVCSGTSDDQLAARSHMLEAVSQLQAIDRRRIDPHVYPRISQARLLIELVDLVHHSAAATHPYDLCNRYTASSEEVAELSTGISRTAEHVLDALPAAESHNDEAAVVLSVLRSISRAIPYADLAQRQSVAGDLSRIVGAYLPVTPHTRRLFLLRGRLAMDMAMSASAAAALPLQPRRQAVAQAQLGRVTDDTSVDDLLTRRISDELSAARLAFENAAVTDTPSQLVEPSPDMEPAILLGDVFFADGDIPASKAAYARSVDAFLVDDAPLDEIGWLANGATKWASLRLATGACSPGAMPERDWDHRWARLEAGTPNLCRFAGARSDSDSSSLLEIMGPVVSGTLRSCLVEPGRNRDWATDRGLRFTVLACLEDNGDRSLQAFKANRSGAAVEDSIQLALGVPRRH